MDVIPLSDSDVSWYFAWIYHIAKAVPIFRRGYFKKVLASGNNCDRNLYRLKYRGIICYIL